MVASILPSTRSGLYADPNEKWLAQHTEPVLDPARPIIDPHHHSGTRRRRYMIDEMTDRHRIGHNVIATVYVEARSMYRATAPEAIRPVGEVEFVNGVAAMSGQRRLRHGAGLRTASSATPISGWATARAPCWRPRSPPATAVSAASGIPRCGTPTRTIAAHRCRAAEGAAAAIRPSARALPPGAARPVFDAWLFHPQIPEFADLARAFPDTRIVLDHCGGPLGIGPYAGRRDEIFATWKASIQELARCPNVVVKLGGLAMRAARLRLPLSAEPPASEELAAAWKPYIETCIEAFGADRCMFESNFPPDKGLASYPVILNAFKRSRPASAEREDRAVLEDGRGFLSAAVLGRRIGAQERFRRSLGVRGSFACARPRRGVQQQSERPVAPQQAGEMIGQHDRLAIEQLRRAGAAHQIAQGPRLVSIPMSFSIFPTSGARTASDIASRNTAMTVGSLVSRSSWRQRMRCAQGSRGRGAPAARRGSVNRLARCDAGDQHLLLTAEQRIELALGDSRARGDLQRRGLREALPGERRERRLQDASADRPGFVASRNWLHMLALPPSPPLTWYLQYHTFNPMVLYGTAREPQKS